MASQASAVLEELHGSLVMEKQGGLRVRIEIHWDSWVGSGGLEYQLVRQVRIEVHWQSCICTVPGLTRSISPQTHSDFILSSNSKKGTFEGSDWVA